MIRALVVTLLLQSAARAEPPAELARRLVELAHAGCGYMASVPHPTSKAITAFHSEPQLAKHFGRILKSVNLNEGALRYLLAMPQLPGWKAQFQARRVIVWMPDDVTLPLGELTRLLGALRPPNVDYKLEPNFDPHHSDGNALPRPTHTDGYFNQPAGWSRCVLHVDVDVVGDDPLRGRVSTFSFQP